MEWAFALEDAESGHPEGIKQLITRLKNPNKQPDDVNEVMQKEGHEHSALHIAAGVKLEGAKPEQASDAIELIKCLIEFKADINLANNTNSTTPLMVAVNRFSVDGVFNLLHEGYGIADPLKLDAKNAQGSTAIEMAENMGEDSQVHKLFNKEPVEVWVNRAEGQSDDELKYEPTTVIWKDGKEFTDADGNALYYKDQQS